MERNRFTWPSQILLQFFRQEYKFERVRRKRCDTNALHICHPCQMCILIWASLPHLSPLPNVEDIVISMLWGFICSLQDLWRTFAVRNLQMVERIYTSNINTFIVLSTISDSRTVFCRQKHRFGWVRRKRCDTNALLARSHGRVRILSFPAFLHSATLAEWKKLVISILSASLAHFQISDGQLSLG